MPNSSTLPMGATDAPDADQLAGQPDNPQDPASTAGPAEPTVEERIAAAVREAEEKVRGEQSSSYRGLQRTLAQIQAENGRLKEQAKALGYLPGIAAGLSTLLSETLGPEKAKILQVQMENEQLKALNTAAQAQQTSPATYQDQPVDLRAAREQALTYWFPDTQLRSEDPRLDWAQDATSPDEAQARFRRSVVKAERQDAAKAAKDEAATAIAEERKRATETLRDAGVERSDGSLPNGQLNYAKNALTSKEPIDWNPRKLMELGFSQQDPKRIREARIAGREIR